MFCTIQMLMLASTRKIFEEVLNLFMELGLVHLVEYNVYKNIICY